MLTEPTRGLFSCFWSGMTDIALFNLELVYGQYHERKRIWIISEHYLLFVSANRQETENLQVDRRRQEENTGKGLL